MPKGQPHRARGALSALLQVLYFPFANAVLCPSLFSIILPIIPRSPQRAIPFGQPHRASEAFFSCSTSGVILFTFPVALDRSIAYAALGPTGYAKKASRFGRAKRRAHPQVLRYTSLITFPHFSWVYRLFCRTPFTRSNGLCRMASLIVRVRRFPVVYRSFLRAPSPALIRYARRNGLRPEASRVGRKLPALHFSLSSYLPSLILRSRQRATPKGQPHWVSEALFSPACPTLYVPHWLCSFSLAL